MKNKELLAAAEDDVPEERVDSQQQSEGAKEEEEAEDDGVRTPPPLPSMLNTSPKMSNEVSSTVNIKTPERSSFEATLNKGMPYLYYLHTCGHVRIHGKVGM